MTKSGYKTTEFWVSLATSAFGVLVALGFVSQVEATELINSVEVIAGSLITAISTGIYAISRGKAKSSNG